MNPLIKLANRRTALMFCLKNLAFLHDVIHLTDGELKGMIDEADRDVWDYLEKKGAERTTPNNIVMTEMCKERIIV